jgi:hypothetical protein
MTAEEIEVEGKRLLVRRTSKQGLRTVTFTMEGRQYAAIEQNPEKPSRWGEIARSGQQVVQFKDVQTNRFVAVAVDGEAKEYGAGKSRGTELDTNRASFQPLCLQLPDLHGRVVTVEHPQPPCEGRFRRSALEKEQVRPALAVR